MVAPPLLTLVLALAVTAPPDSARQADLAVRPAISHYLRARVAIGSGDAATAAQEMDLAIAFDPSSAALRAAAADLFLAIGKPSRAAGEARRAIDLGRKSDAEAAARGHAVLGRLAASESRWGAAAAELVAGEGALTPEDRFVLGVALEAQRRWVEAAAAFGRIDGADDELQSLAQLRRADALSRARRTAEALEVVARSERHGDVRFASMRAHVLARAGRSDDAAAGLRRQIATMAERAPPEPGARDLVDALAAVLLAAGRADEALLELERGLSWFPRDPKLLIGAASALQRAGDLDRAVARAGEVLEEDPDDVEALNFVGYLLAERGVRLDEAERLLVRAAELAPGDGAVLDSLGWLWFRKGETQQAIRTLERADALAGPDATILDHLGDAYRAARRNRDAARVWRRAIAEIDADLPAPAGEAERARAQRAAIAKKLGTISGAHAVR